MWRTVSARIRGAKQELIDSGLETEGMVESTSKLRDNIKALTGFDIMADENTYKDIMEIIIGIGDAWKDLTDIEQAGLLEQLAGKQQSNALAAALENVDLIKEVYQTAQNSEGSAQEELEAHLESIEGRLQILANSWQELWYNGINSDFIKFWINVADKLLEVANNVGLVQSALATLAGGIAGIKVLKDGGGRVKLISLL